MANGGRRSASSRRSDTRHRSSGVRLFSTRSRRNAPQRRSSRSSAPRRRPVLTLRRDILRAVVFFLLCFFMLSPVRGCILSDGDYIGRAKAQSIAADDAGIPQDKVRDMHSDMIKIDDKVYYKVQFTGSVTDYRYIIDAETGEILTQVFYRLDKSG